jgi:glycosyltransferase involved in cell wall biosynthesis
MKLLIVDCSDFESYPPGGSKIFIRNFLKFAGNIDISLAGITTERKKFDYGKGKISIDGIEYTFYPFAWIPRIGEGRKPIIPIRLRSFLGLIKKLHWILRDKFDVAYVHFPELAFPLLYPKKKLPLVFHLHGLVDPAVTYSRYPWIRRNKIIFHFFRKMNKLVLDRADKILVVSEEGLKVCHNLAPGSVERLQIIPPSVDTNLFQPKDKIQSRLALGLPVDAEIILSVGRIESGKGMDLLLDAFILLSPKQKNMYLIIAGEGSEKRILEKRVNNFGLSDRIRFLGEVNHENLPILFSAADVFALASKSEGLPTVILEALACGIPIVATAVGDIPKVIINGQTGYLVYSRNPKDFAVALAKALESGSRLKKNCLEMAENYSAIKIASKVMRILVSVI